jgi:hypothetical protein
VCIFKYLLRCGRYGKEIWGKGEGVKGTEEIKDEERGQGIKTRNK